jgi:integrase
MRQNNAIIKLPKLYDAAGDLDQRWFVYYTYRNPVTGKNKRFKVYDGFAGLNTEKQRREHAQKMIEELTTKLTNGYNPFGKEDVVYQDDLRYRKASDRYKLEQGKLRTVPYLANLFMQQKKNALRLSSEHTYRSKMRRLKKYCIEKKLDEADIAMFTAEVADDFIRYLFIDHKLGNKSVNEYIRLMREFWEYANIILLTQGRQIENVFKLIRRFRHEVKKPQVYNMGQIKKLGEIVEKEDPQLWLMMRLLFNCFIRPNEQRYLKIGNIDFVASRVMIPASISKNKKDDWVDIPEYIIEDMIEMGYDKSCQNDFVFTAKRKPGPRCVSRNYFYKRFCKYRDEVGLPKELILYSLKHTGVAQLKISGADVIEIKNQLRHHSLDQVMGYLHSLIGQTSEHIRKKGPRI